ncbi:MAG TPA: PaaI family thioesterase [Candidatus Binataceae bacterium]|nr:PaaI family thioesterase [Candidatus Binataceae bacterium]
MDYRKMLEDHRIPLAELLGIRFLSAEPARVTAELLVRAEICTVPAILHGGAIMAFADTLGACATMINLPKGAGTTTLESKTNFLAGVPAGSKVIGECTPIHRGKSTMVWQTKISLESGKLCAIVTQTQMVLQPRG